MIQQKPGGASALIIKMKQVILNIVIAVFAVTIITALAIVYLFHIQRNVEYDICQSLSEISEQSALLIKERINGNFKSLESMADFVSESGYDFEDIALVNHLNRMISKSAFQRVTIADTNGQCYYWDYSGEEIPLSTEKLQIVLKGQSVVTDVKSDLEYEANTIVLAVPVYKNGHIIGAAVGKFYAEDINRLLTISTFEGKGYSYIANSEGEVFINSKHASADKMFKNIMTDFDSSKFEHKEDLPQMLQAIKEGKRGQVFYSWNDKDRIMNYTPIGINDWYLLSVVPRDVVTYKSFVLFHMTVWFVCMLFGVFILLIIYVFYLQKKSSRKLHNAHKELKNLYNALPGGIFGCKKDEKWTMLFANDGFYRFTGYTPETFEKKCYNTIEKLLFEEDRERVRDSEKQQLEKSNFIGNETRIVCADGSIKWIWINAELTENKKYGIYFYCTFLDTTARKEMQDKLTLNQQRYEIIMSQTQDTIFEWNRKEKSVYYSKNFVKKFGYQLPQNDYPKSILNAQVIFSEDLKPFFDAFQTLLEKENYITKEVRLRKAQQGFIWCRISATALRNKEGTADKVIGIISDIENEKRKIQEIEEMAKKDSLTQLYHKGAVEHNIICYLEQSDKPAAFFMLDIDNFKGFNDTLGHLFGDAILKEISNTLKLLFSDNSIIGRIGGDEFVVFLKNISSTEVLYEKADLLIDYFKNSFIQKEINCKISVSIGISLYPNDGTTYDCLYQKADTALYYAKEHGKNQYALYKDSITN